MMDAVGLAIVEAGSVLDLLELGPALHGFEQMLSAWRKVIPRDDPLLWS